MALSVVWGYVRVGVLSERGLRVGGGGIAIATIGGVRGVEASAWDGGSGFVGGSSSDEFVVLVAGV